jgi:hypothetical protein
MGLLKKAVVEQQKTSVVAYVALGVSIFTMLCVIGLVASHRDN